MFIWRMPNQQDTLVVARYREDLSWLVSVPRDLRVVVYNKGLPWEPPLALQDRHIEVVPLLNVGRESDTIAQHLLLHRDALPEWTYFAQGGPFAHAPHLLDLLGKPAAAPLFQPLSAWYLREREVPPLFVVDYHQRFYKVVWRAERIAMRTLDSVYFHDKNIHLTANAYGHKHGLPVGANLMHHFFCLLGLGHWLSHEAEVTGFAYGAIFRVSKEAVLQHPPQVYGTIRDLSRLDWFYGYMIERSWMLLFDRDGALASPPMHEPAPLLDNER